MTTVVYSGQFDWLDIPTPAGDHRLVRDIPTEIPADLAGRLVAQDPDVTVTRRRARVAAAVEVNPV